MLEVIKEVSEAEDSSLSKLSISSIDEREFKSQLKIGLKETGVRFKGEIESERAEQTDHNNSERSKHEIEGCEPEKGKKRSKRMQQIDTVQEIEDIFTSIKVTYQADWKPEEDEIQAKDITKKENKAKDDREKMFKHRVSYQVQQFRRKMKIKKRLRKEE